VQPLADPPPCHAALKLTLWHLTTAAAAAQGRSSLLAATWLATAILLASQLQQNHRMAQVLKWQLTQQGGMQGSS
jgi:hypothetical protein